MSTKNKNNIPDTRDLRFVLGKEYTIRKVTGDIDVRFARSTLKGFNFVVLATGAYYLRKHVYAPAYTGKSLPGDLKEFTIRVPRWCRVESKVYNHAAEMDRQMGEICTTLWDHPNIMEADTTADNIRNLLNTYRTALHDAIKSPAGVVPLSAVDVYDPTYNTRDNETSKTDKTTM